MRKFNIILYGNYTLTEAQIWPDDDGPENPTEQDVVDAINADGGPDEVVTRWNMGVDIDVDDVTEHAPDAVHIEPDHRGDGGE